MRIAPKKILPFVLLLLAALPLIFAAYVQTSEAIIHHQMREELEQKNLSTVRVHPSQLIWTDKGSECRINGDMFDVESYSVLPNKDIVLTGLFDKDEDALFAKITNSSTNNSNATTNTLALKWFSCFAFEMQHDKTVFHSQANTLTYNLSSNIYFDQPVVTVVAPPPKSASL